MRRQDRSTDEQLRLMLEETTEFLTAMISGQEWVQFVSHTFLILSPQDPHSNHTIELDADSPCTLSKLVKNSFSGKDVMLGMAALTIGHVISVPIQMIYGCRRRLRPNVPTHHQLLTQLLTQDTLQGMARTSVNSL